MFSMKHAKKKDSSGAVGCVGNVKKLLYNKDWFVHSGRHIKAHVNIHTLKKMLGYAVQYSCKLQMCNQ